MKTKLYPEKLKRENYFASPIWTVGEPQFVKELNKASDPYIKAAKKKLADDIKKRNKTYGNKGDKGFVYHSTSLAGDPKFNQLSRYIVDTATNLLKEMGHDLNNHVVFLTELWVQEFPKDGCGYHSAHSHWNGHISGFYFLKSGETTSRPVFHDPRPGKTMIGLPEIKKENITYASPEIFYNTKPGTMVFFPSYLTHEYPPDLGYDTFRFIHWNCQAIPKESIKSYINEY
tara:strand:+ start:2971 stop:3660 length:690 start_codon:yes stop_codon:yes gene_type:complete